MADRRDDRRGRRRRRAPTKTSRASPTTSRRAERAPTRPSADARDATSSSPTERRRATDDDGRRRRRARRRRATSTPAFFAAGIAARLHLGKVLVAAIWSALADWPAARPQRCRSSAASPKTSATTITLVVGAVDRRSSSRLRTTASPSVRTWTDEVAAELSKVNWPSRKEVTNSHDGRHRRRAPFATVYFALLDRFWGFVTNLVYGA